MPIINCWGPCCMNSLSVETCIETPRHMMSIPYKQRDSQCKTCAVTHSSATIMSLSGHHLLSGWLAPHASVCSRLCLFTLALCSLLQGQLASQLCTLKY